MKEVKLNKHMYDNNSSIFQRYVSLTTQKPILVDKVISKLDNNFLNREMHFLDIGCGDGIVTMPIIETLNKTSKVIATCIEPSSDLLKDFKSMTTMNIEFINKDVESLDQLPKSDFILLSHVLPYISDRYIFLDKVIEALNPNGRALIVVSNPNGDDLKVKNMVLNKESDTSLSTTLQNILNKQKISFNVEMVESTIDVSGVTEMNEDGKTIIEFFKHLKFNDISDDDIQKIRHTVLNIANEKGQLIKREDYIWIEK